jgi:hypothetical protein
MGLRRPSRNGITRHHESPQVNGYPFQAAAGIKDQELVIIAENGSPTLHLVTSKYPPAKPGALGYEPLKAAVGG